MINELDRAEIRHQMRELYRDIGYEGALDCLNEIFVTAEMLSQVILEERFNEEV